MNTNHSTNEYRTENGKTTRVHHDWNDEYCSCGCDSVTCQQCGRRVCGELTETRQTTRGTVGNVCYICRPLTTPPAFNSVTAHQNAYWH